MFMWGADHHKYNLGPAIGPGLTGFIVTSHLTSSSTLYLYFVFNLAYSSQQIYRYFIGAHSSQPFHFMCSCSPQPKHPSSQSTEVRLNLSRVYSWIRRVMVSVRISSRRHLVPIHFPIRLEYATSCVLHPIDNPFPISIPPVV